MEKWLIVWHGTNTGVIRLRNVYDDGTLIGREFMDLCWN
jgi:hypothetical protein